MTAKTTANSPIERRLRMRHFLILLLTVNAGATDAIGFIALGEAFTSVMTGNLVLLGIATSGGDRKLVIHVLTAVACYVIGCVIGARLVGEARGEVELWPRMISIALGVEFAVLVATAIAWWVSGSVPIGTVQLVILGGNAAALGIQSSSVLRFGVSGLSTTYMTGTLTKVIASFIAHRKPGRVADSVQVLLSLVLGGFVGALLVSWSPMAAPIMQLAAVGTVLICSIALIRPTPGPLHLSSS